MGSIFKFKVVHENSPPSEIVFTVRQLPVHGYIRKFSSEESCLGADQRPVLSFTQQDVDEGKVQYMQTVSDQLEDRFSLDVTNGIQTVSGIEISVDIIPKIIPLEVQNFTVIEGGSKALVEDYLQISSGRFAGLSCEFILVEQPKHGYIENSHVPGIKLTTFTRKQVMHLNLLCYSHNYIFVPLKANFCLQWDNFGGVMSLLIENQYMHNKLIFGLLALRGKPVS